MFNRQLEWNETEIPFPSDISWGFQEISSTESGRTLSGTMIKEIIATKRKLSCSWKCLNDGQANTLLQTVKTNTFGNLKYPDAFTGSNVTKVFYTGDATAEMKTINNNKALWNISFDFIER